MELVARSYRETETVTDFPGGLDKATHNSARVPRGGCHFRRWNASGGTSLLSFVPVFVSVFFCFVLFFFCFFSLAVSSSSCGSWWLPVAHYAFCFAVPDFSPSFFLFLSRSRRARRKRFFSLHDEVPFLRRPRCP